MKNENIYDKWHNFINSDKYKQYFISDKEKWYNKLNLVKKYIDTNNKRPSAHNEENNIKTLGSWIYNQKNNYIKNKDIMKDKNIKKIKKI